MWWATAAHLGWNWGLGYLADLRTSLDLFLDHGFDATTIDTICADVGMSRRTIYSRYGDKETLFKAALQRAIDQWIIPVERLRDQECEDLEATLVAVARLWVSNIKKKWV